MFTQPRLQIAFGCRLFHFVDGGLVETQPFFREQVIFHMCNQRRLAFKYYIHCTPLYFAPVSVSVVIILFLEVIELLQLLNVNTYFSMSVDDRFNRAACLLELLLVRREILCIPESENISKLIFELCNSSCNRSSQLLFLLFLSTITLFFTMYYV